MKLPVLSTLLIILVLLTSSVRRTLTLSDTNSRITDELIHDICSKTRNPHLCLKNLDSLRGTTLSPKPLVSLGTCPMNTAQSQANATTNAIWDHYSSMPPHQSVLKKRYYRCVAKYVDAMHQLNEAKKFMLAGEGKWVKAFTLLALDRVDSCDVELMKPPRLNYRFLQANREFKGLCDIILEICNKLSF